MDDNLVEVSSQQLAEHLKLIHQIAWTIHTKSGYDVDDLFSEGCLQYLLKRNRYRDDSGTKYTTFIWEVVWRSLLDYLKGQPRLHHVDINDDLLITTDSMIGTNYTKHQVKDIFYQKSF